MIRILCRTSRGLLLAIVALLCSACEPDTTGTRDGSPREHLPPYITELPQLGATAMRPTFAGDNNRFLYLDNVVGDVYEYDLTSGERRAITAHFEHDGFTRVNYLANGDILLCGPVDVDPDDPEQGRWNTEFWYLHATLDRPAIRMHEQCFEGPAVSRNSMRVAWTRTNYPERVVFQYNELWMGEIEFDGEQPGIVNHRKLVERRDFNYLGVFEPQDFRPPDENELVFTAYAYRGGEVMGIDLESGELTNYSQNWGFEESEAIVPDGRYILVERERTLRMNPRGRIDLWLLRLDGSGEFTRLTHFSEFKGFGANNPGISPDCRYMIFALREVDGLHGNSQGLFLYDFAESPHTPPDFCGAG